jgi:hypothetical protein
LELSALVSSHQRKPSRYRFRRGALDRTDAERGDHGRVGVVLDDKRARQAGGAGVVIGAAQGRFVR